MSDTNSNDNKPGRIVGLIVVEDGQFRLKPCDKKKFNTCYQLTTEDLNGAKAGDIVVAETQGSKNLSNTKVTRIIGQENTPGILSLISLYEKGLKAEFSKAAKAEAKALTVADLNGREDLRKVPLVTIDGPDSRDFDDAVFAETLPDGGFHLIVAIADVSYYVRPDTALDDDAYVRGNSTYFPDMVAPMLPEEISNGLCSLNPHEDRAVMHCHINIDKDGNMTSYEFKRGLMNSAARLTYEQAQNAKDGNPDATTTPLMDTVINPLYAAYALLRKARETRGALDLDIPEQKEIVDASGKVVSVGSKARHESCKVIEEFMVIANVAAASALEDKNAPCVYRTHSSPQKPGAVEELRRYLSNFSLTLPAGDIESASVFNDIMKQAASLPEAKQIANTILRAQAKASYDTKNIGHFGLALEKYAHFTSPIRRYADLLVHRSLVDAFNLGGGGLDDEQRKELQEMAEHISRTEFVSSKAERRAHERHATSRLAKKIGQEFNGRVTDVSKAGLSVRIKGAGTDDGLIPLRNLTDDVYDFDTKKYTLTGRTHGRVYKRGDSVKVTLEEADALSGNIVLKAANDNNPAQQPQAKNTNSIDKKSGPGR